MEGDGKTENCTILGPERWPGKTLLIAVDFAGCFEFSTAIYGRLAVLSGVTSTVA